MPFIRVPYRLVSRQNLDKADVESVYAEIVRVIGGTYYVNGVPQAPVNGVLDWRNFAPDAGFTNDHKSAPYNIWTMSLPVAQTAAASTYDLALSSATSEYPSTVVLLGFVAMCSGFAAAVNAGTYTVQYYLAGGVAPVNLGAAITWNNVAVGTVLLPPNQYNSINLTLPQDATLRVVGSNTGSPPIEMIVTFYFKSLHVK